MIDDDDDSLQNIKMLPPLWSYVLAITSNGTIRAYLTVQ